VLCYRGLEQFHLFHKLCEPFFPAQVEFPRFKFSQICLS
jgi:hypothetical protein